MKCLALFFALIILPCAAVLADNPSTSGVANPGDHGPMLIQTGNMVGEPGGGGWAMGNPKDAAKMYIQSLSSSITLTDDQQQQINDIFADRAKQLADFDSQNAEKIKAASTAMAKAFSAQDQAAMAKALQDYQATYAPMHDIMSKSSASLDKFLTPAQKAQLADARVTAAIKMIASPAVLTDNQVKAVKAAVNVGDNIRESYPAIKEALDNILTPEQKAAINKGRALAAIKTKFFRANLTADQLTQVDAACDQLLKDPSLELKAITDALDEKTKALLTPDQKKAMEPNLNGYGIRRSPGGETR